MKLRNTEIIKTIKELDLNDNLIFIDSFVDDSGNMQWVVLPKDNCMITGRTIYGYTYCTNYYSLFNINPNPNKFEEISCEKGFVAEIDNDLSLEDNIVRNLQRFARRIKN